MKPLKRTCYYTMNSWNKSTAPAYNLKVYNVINDNLQSVVYDLLTTSDLYETLGLLIQDSEVPTPMLKSFRTLALPIVHETEYMAKRAIADHHFKEPNHVH